MSIQFTFNVWVVLAILVMGIGAFLAFFGFISSLYPVGHGGGLEFLMPTGLVMFVVGLLYSLYRLGAFFRFWS